MQAWMVQTFRRTFHANPHSSALRGIWAWKVNLLNCKGNGYRPRKVINLEDLY